MRGTTLLRTEPMKASEIRVGDLFEDAGGETHAVTRIHRGPELLAIFNDNETDETLWVVLNPDDLVLVGRP